MGLRFRRSLKLAPGIRMNFSGSGISWTLGPRGASVGIGRRGSHLNLGIPGTGISFRERIDTPHASAPSPASTTTISATVNVKDDGSLECVGPDGTQLPPFWIERAKKQHREAILGLIQSACDKVNGQIEALGEIHVHTPAPGEHERYLRAPYSQQAPREPALLALGILAKLFKTKRVAIEAENNRRIEAYAQARATWEVEREVHARREERRRNFLEQQILIDRGAMEAHLETRLSEIVWPRETTLAFEVGEHGRAAWLDVDLPEIEDMPRRTANVPSRGLTLSVKEMSAAQVQRLYMRHVHGVCFRIVGEVFAALPTVQLVVLSAFSQRASKVTGQVAEAYLISLKVSRAEWGRIDFKNLEAIDIVEALGAFELRREMTKAGAFRPIEPFGVQAETSNATP